MTDAPDPLVGRTVTWEPKTNTEREAVRMAASLGHRWVVQRVATVQAGRLRGERCALLFAVGTGRHAAHDWRWVPTDRLTPT